MDRLAKCLGTLVDDGHLSRQQAEEALADVKRAVRKNAEIMALPEAERKAVADVLAAKAAEARRQKYLTALQAMKLKELAARADAHPQGRQAAFLGALTKDWTGHTNGANVEYRASAIHALLDRAALALFDRYAPKKLGFQEQTAGLHLVIRELFGEDTGDAAAKAAAKAWRETAEKARQWFNNAGGDIGQLDTWRLPQSHDQLRILDAGFEKWAHTLDEVGAEIFDAHGNPLRGLERQTALREVYETLSTGGTNKLAPGSTGGGKKLANKRASPRVLHFQNADGWLRYHEEFGTGSLYSTFAGHLRAMSRDIAALEVLGPNPAATVRWMRDMAEKSAPGSGRMIERTWDAIAGNAEVATGWRRYLYAGMQNTRNLLRSAQMGSAILSSVGDLETVRATASWNGLETTGVLRWYTRQLNPASAEDRRFARRAGLIADATSRAMSNSRVVDEDLGKGFTAKLANATFELSGLNAHTNGLRAAFQMEAMATLAENAGKAWDDLPAPLRGMLERGGLDQAMWDAARKAPMLDHAGVKFLDALELAASGDKLTREAGLRLQQAILQETDMAVPVPDARARAWMDFGTKPNTFMREVVRTATMYRSFPVTITLTHGYRAFHAGAGMGRRIAYAAPLLINLTALGALSVQMKQVAAGKDPRDMEDWKFWGQAIAQGGGLGILGDFFGAALSRTDKDLAGTLAGTGYGLLSDVLNLTTRNAMAEAEGKPANTVGDLIGFLQRYQPGSNLWWARTAVDRLFWSQLRLADPQAPRDYARMEAKAARDYGQRFWWRPGDLMPERAPDLTAAYGGSR